MLLETQAVSDLDFSVLVNALTSAITPEKILAIIAMAVGAVAGIFLVKWGASLVVNAFQRITHGKNIRV